MDGNNPFGSMGGEALSPDELAIIDEGMGLGNVRDMIRQTAEVNRRLGLGEDLQRAHDRHLIGPSTDEIMARVEPPARKRPVLQTRPKSTSQAQATGRTVYQTVRSIPVVPNEIVISNFRVSGDHSYRIDVGIEGRTDILIANLSQVVIWVSAVSVVSPTVGNFIGVPLKAMSGANVFDGGVLRLSLRNAKHTRFWAQAVAGAPPVYQLTATIETAIRE